MKTISHHAALVYVMVVVSAADGAMSDKELKAIGDLTRTLPVFKDFDRDRLLALAQDCSAILQEDDGLSAVLGLVKDALARASARNRLLAGARSRALRHPGEAGGSADHRSAAPRAWARPSCRRRAWNAGRGQGIRSRETALPPSPRQGRTRQTPASTTKRRVLAPRGREDAARIGRFLNEEVYVADLVLCSTAARTRETLELVLPQLNAKPAVQYLDELYHGGFRGDPRSGAPDARNRRFADDRRPQSGAGGLRALPGPPARRPQAAQAL